MDDSFGGSWSRVGSLTGLRVVTEVDGGVSAEGASCGQQRDLELIHLSMSSCLYKATVIRSWGLHPSN